MKRIDMTHIFSLNNPLNSSWFKRYTLCIPNNLPEINNLKLVKIKKFKINPIYKIFKSKRWKFPEIKTISFDEYYNYLQNLIYRNFIVLEKKVAYPQYLKVDLYIYSGVVQQECTSGSYPEGRRFKSCPRS